MYKNFIRKILFLFNPEKAHQIVFSLLKFPFISKFLKIIYFRNKYFIPTIINNIKFPNKLGLAAGLDKDGEVIESLASLGFGFIEIGTITPKPQPGNPKPRLFRLVDQEALINRMGFNNSGVDNLIENLKKLKNKNFVLGINIGKNKNTPIDEAYKDYVYCFEKLYDYADYFAINVSSPNTPELRKLQDAKHLEKIIIELQKINNQKKQIKPIFVKIAPDLNNSQILEIIAIVKETGITGIIATNTTIDKSMLPQTKKYEEGGLSGKPLKNKSNQIIKFIKENSENKFFIIGVGGVFDYKDYKEKIECGADLVQLYTSFIYEGPGIVKKILKNEVKYKQNNL